MKIVKRLFKNSLKAQTIKSKRRDKKLNSKSLDDYYEVMAEISRQEVYLDSFLNGGENVGKENRA